MLAHPAMNFSEAFMSNASGASPECRQQTAKWNVGPSAFPGPTSLAGKCFSDIFYHTRSDEVFCTVRSLRPHDPQNASQIVRIAARGSWLRTGSGDRSRYSCRTHTPGMAECLQ